MINYMSETISKVARYIFVLILMCTMGTCTYLAVDDARTIRQYEQKRYTITGNYHIIATATHQTTDDCDMSIYATMDEALYEISIWKHGYRSPDKTLSRIKLHSANNTLIYSGECADKMIVTIVSNGDIYSNPVNIEITVSDEVGEIHDGVLIPTGS